MKKPFIEKIADVTKIILGYEQKSAPNPFDAPIFSQNQIGNTFTSERAQLGAYSQLPWISIAVDCLVRDCANQEYYFTDRSGKVIEEKNIPDDILMPFKNDFIGISFRQMLRMAVAHRAITGNAYFIRYSQSAYGMLKKIPDVFVPVVPDWLFIEENQFKLGINRYIVNFPTGQSLTVIPEDMIHFRQNTIYDPWMGVGNITKARLMFEGGVSAEEFRNSVLDKRGSPGLVITDRSTRTTSDQDRLNSLIRSKTEGKDNAGRTFYMSGDDVKVYTLSISAADMQYIEKEQFDRQTTLSLFGVPPVVAGIPEDSNKATSGTMRLLYLANTCNPIISEMEEAINHAHMRLVDPNILFKFKRHVTGDIDNVIKLSQAGIVSLNRAAEMIGEAVDMSDDSRNVFYIPSNLISTEFAASAPVESAPIQDTPQANGSDGGKIVLKKVLENPHNVDDICGFFLKSAPKAKQFQAKYLRASLISRAGIEDKYTAKLSDFFEAQKKRILKAVEDRNTGKAASDDVGVNLIFDINAENDELEAEVRKLHTSGVQKAMGDITEITGVRMNLNLSNPFVLRAVNQLGAKIRGTVNETTQSDLKKIMVKAVNESWNINEIQDAIQGKFDQFQGYRARMIARTESRAAWDAGSKVAYQQLGVETVDIVGCTQDYIQEGGGDCGREGVPVAMIDSLDFHPNHIGSPAPSKDPTE